MRKLIASVLVVLVAACSGPIASLAPATLPGATPGPTTEASAGPSSSEAPSASPPPASPSAGPSIGTLQVLLPGSAVEVAVRDLNIRRKPSTSAKLLGTLRRGEVLIVSPVDNIALGWGPVKANGYTWYPVMKIQVEGSDGRPPELPRYPIVIGTEPFSGWVASDDGTEPYLTAVAPRCPTSVDLANVSGMLPAERLACFGGPFVLEGTFGCGGCGALMFGTYKPAWLATPVELDFLSVDPTEQVGPLALRFPPDGPPLPANGAIIRVTVHVDDPRSTRCTITDREAPDGPGVAVDDETAHFYCRERLVVESYEVLGTNPDFPG
jgi:hypothetical protein